MSQTEASQDAGRMRRARPHIAAALIVAALVGSLITSVALSLLTAGAGLGAVLAMWFFIAIVSLLAVATFGIGWHVWAIRRGWTGYFAYAGAGLALGAFIPVAIFALFSFSGAPAPAATFIGFGVIGGFQGLVTSSIVWWIRRPGADAKPQDVADVFR